MWCCSIPATQTIRDSRRSLHGNCDYTLLEGRKLRGRVEKVFLRGNLIVDGPQWLGREGMGRFVPRGSVQAFLAQARPAHWHGIDDCRQLRPSHGVVRAQCDMPVLTDQGDRKCRCRDVIAIP
jgi:hypothetical protein